MVGRGEHVFKWLIIGVIAVALVSTIGPSVIAETGKEPTSWFYHYQGLIGGILTIAAALLGGACLSKQVRQDARLERERIAHDREAERAVLPLTLSAIYDYAIMSGRLGKSLLDQCLDGRLPNEVVVDVSDLRVLPDGTVTSLQQMIRALEFDQMARTAQDFLIHTLYIRFTVCRPTTTLFASFYLKSIIPTASGPQLVIAGGGRAGGNL